MVWIIPTLSRPEQCAAVVAQAARLDKTAKGIVVVNGGTHAKEYVDLVGNHLPDGWEMRILPENIGALGALNYAFEEFPSEPFYGFIGDDEFVYSPDWSLRLAKAAGPWGISNANDGWQSHKRIHSYVCIGGELARSVGFLALKECWHWAGFDCMWEALDRELGLKRFVSDIKTEHRHFLVHKVAKDACYALGEAKSKEDMLVFDTWMRSDMPMTAEKIRMKRGGISIHQ